jgi:hypothetical protein
LVVIIILLVSLWFYTFKKISVWLFLFMRIRYTNFNFFQSRKPNESSLFYIKKIFLSFFLVFSFLEFFYSGWIPAWQFPDEMVVILRMPRYENSSTQNLQVIILRHLWIRLCNCLIYNY